MKREIKFRAWDKFRKSMTDRRECGPVLIWEDGLSSGVFELRADQFIMMQYTGLKDKNGKEIYEGDIVETIYRDNLPHKGTIYFQPTRLNWSVKHSGFTNQDLFVYSRPDCSVEIIGNIYESPELMEARDIEVAAQQAEVEAEKTLRFLKTGRKHD